MRNTWNCEVRREESIRLGETVRLVGFFVFSLLFSGAFWGLGYLLGTIN
jgi:hypothetical protein